MPKKRRAIRIPVKITGFVMVYDEAETPEHIREILDMCIPTMLGNKMNEVVVEMLGEPEEIF